MPRGRDGDHRARHQQYASPTAHCGTDGRSWLRWPTTRSASRPTARLLLDARNPPAALRPEEVDGDRGPAARGAVAAAPSDAGCPHRDRCLATGEPVDAIT